MKGEMALAFERGWRRVMTPERRFDGELLCPGCFAAYANEVTPDINDAPKETVGRSGHCLSCLDLRSSPNAFIVPEDGGKLFCNLAEGHGDVHKHGLFQWP
jgi:hypothetical protein